MIRITNLQSKDHQKIILVVGSHQSSVNYNRWYHCHAHRVWQMVTRGAKACKISKDFTSVHALGMSTSLLRLLLFLFLAFLSLILFELSRLIGSIKDDPAIQNMVINQCTTRDKLPFFTNPAAIIYHQINHPPKRIHTNRSYFLNLIPKRH